MNPIRRLSRKGAQQQAQANASLTGAEALAAYESQSPAAGYPTGPEATSKPAVRMATPKWSGKTGVLNHAQAAQGGAGPVWVTVPVDKVVVSSSGSAKTAPVYATPEGYQSAPGESVGSIPPVWTRSY